MFEFDNGSHGTYKVSDPDGIQSINGSYRVIIFNDYNSPISCGGVAYSDDFPEGTTPGKVFAMTISFETIIGDSIRTIVMEEVLDFLNNCDVSIKPVEIPQTAVLNSPYPNPFNPRTAIGVQLSAVSDMNLSIYNLAGQKVHTLVSGIKDAGNYKFPSFECKNICPEIPAAIMKRPMSVVDWIGSSKTKRIKIKDKNGTA